ncbi:uncharacterized protein LOC111115097 [Crassostrea virginica]
MMRTLGIFLSFLIFQFTTGQIPTLIGLPQCKWANEECADNDQCCSQSCVLKNPGTNRRCSRSSIGQECLYVYHCEDRLLCGDRRKCCASYWETCSRNQHCCDTNHRCLRAEGATYRKCLYPPTNTGVPLESSWVLGVVILLRVLFMELTKSLL